MPWTVLLHPAFEPEFEALPLAVQEALAASATLLTTHGPMLGRPHADTLGGSRHANMKELRFAAQDGVWRAAFAFDPALGGWVHSVDGAVLGGDWASVAAVCSEQHYKPGLLLYQVHPSQF